MQKCTKCNKPHNSLLPLEGFSNQVQQNRVEAASPDFTTAGAARSETPEDVNHQAGTSSVLGWNVSINSHSVNRITTAPVGSQILLATAIIKVKVNNELITCRALLDGGSQSNFITDNLCKKLNSHPSRVNHIVKGVGQRVSNIILPRITDKLPMISFDKGVLNIPGNLSLADPTFDIPNDIDLLLGSNVFLLILASGQRQLHRKLKIRDNSGRFIVDIPFKKTLRDLGNSREMALKRFHALEGKFIRHPELGAYGADLYIRCRNSSGNYISNLLCAKSRVAPLKQFSLP
ncbi:hypothetical protein NQ314_014080 [Rhamnusium bicolor]|uniref:Peptidase aspartic putative domain-containing protein n=1 Tax=Rhamnusium bicolor TaxID=1586634 RepID=A0AAV8X3L2_9CUCU|nr:hypothetical protein NQ314_014080 [Rhamnusium bicolor]